MRIVQPKTSKNKANIVKVNKLAHIIILIIVKHSREQYVYEMVLYLSKNKASDQFRNR